MKKLSILLILLNVSISAFSQKLDTIIQRPLFRSRDTGDSLAEQKSRVIVTREVNSNGTPSVRLPGRNVVGTLPMPQHNIPNATGEVVVSIRVDQHGNLTSANVTQTGTTVQNRTLWDAAVEAALKTKFNVSSNAPIVQAGFITYVFNLPNSDKKVDRKKSPPRR